MAGSLSNDFLKEAFLNKHDEIVNALLTDDIVDIFIPPRILTPTDIEKLNDIKGEKNKSRKFMLMIHNSKNPETFIHLVNALERSERSYQFLVDDVLKEYNELVKSDEACVTSSTPMEIECVGTNDVQTSTEPGISVQGEDDCLESPEEINLLVIGATGVGKSTWINALACYLTYATLDEAMLNDIVCPIATTFTVTDESEDSYDSKVVVYEPRAGRGAGDVPVECLEPGKSGTQCPCNYVFLDNDMTVRIIDSPGMGSTGKLGLHDDKKNISVVMDYVSNLDNLHGIVFLLRPDEHKLTDWFRYCMTELMTNLHRDLVKNIFFCLTHARSTEYKPGSSFTILKEWLKEFDGIGFELTKKNLFCMDNESVKAIIAYHRGIQYSQHEIEQFGKSWKRSISESRRLIESLTRLTPHDAQVVISITTARKAIKILLRPLAEILNVHQVNIAIIKRKMATDNSDNSRDTESEPLEQISAERLLASPRTVCLNPRCPRASTVTLLGQTFPLYDKPCHDNCRQKCGQDVPGSKFNWFCSVINFMDKCQVCKCSRRHHMFITYITRYAVIGKKDDVDALLQRKRELEDECRKIIKTSAMLGCFLKQNAVAYSNDAFIVWLDTLLNGADSNDPTAVAALRDLRARYLQEQDDVEKFIALGKLENLQSLSVTKIKSMCAELCELSHSGKELRDAMQLAETYARKRSRHFERTFVCKRPILPGRKNKKHSSTFKQASSKMHSHKSPRQEAIGEA